MPAAPPLITIAAKLLFVARKEIFPIGIPPHLPQAPGPGIVGITQEDFREVNRSPGARLCRVVTWDWDNGRPKRVGGVVGDGLDIEDEDWEESKVWDTEWWRRLLCRDCELGRPKYLPGDVFKLGSMRGNWHGREYVRFYFIHLFLLLKKPIYSSHKETSSSTFSATQTFLIPVYLTKLIPISSRKLLSAYL